MQLKWPMLWDLFSLFPAYAGVIPLIVQSEPQFFAFPRIRGGDPGNHSHEHTEISFSPHTRG